MTHEQADEIILLLRAINGALADVVPSRLRIWTRRERRVGGDLEGGALASYRGTATTPLSLDDDWVTLM